MRIWIGAGFGVALLGLGGLIPFVVPARDQTEVMVITVFFELTGAMLVWSALSGPSSAGIAPRSSGGRAVWVASGLAIAAAGLLLPLLQKTDSADGRFLWMSAFAPMALIGVALAWRAIPERWKELLRGSDDDGPSGGRKAPVPRLGAGSPARRFLPAALVILAAALVIAMIIALIATVLVAGVAL
jgi:hypothetical protein